MFVPSNDTVMRLFGVLIIFFMLATVAGAQTRISGKVLDTKGKPLVGASITLVNTYDGAIADSAGNFSFKTTEKGSFQLEASIVGYAKQLQNMALGNGNLTVNFSLKESLDELKAVTVTAGSFEAGDKKRAATVLSSLDVYTTGGANADITAAAKTLPGAQQIGEQEGLFVRGGAGFETRQFIDGTTVDRPFNASIPDIASRGRFAPNLFKGTVFSTGGYSALYGQALSSALILESIDLPTRSEATVSVSTVFLGGGTQQLNKKKNLSYGVNYGYTNLAVYFGIVPQRPDYFHMPEFHTADANLRFKTKRGGMLKYYTQYSASRIGLRRPNIDSTGLKNAFDIINYNWYNNLSYRENLGNGWKLNVGLSYSTNTDNIFQQLQNSNNNVTTTGKPWLDNTNFQIESRSDLAQAKVVFDKRLSGISVLRFGSEYWYNNTYSGFNGRGIRLQDHFTAGFAEADIYITNDIAAKVGTRVEHNSIINQWNIAPRASIAYKTGKHAQVSAIYGMYYQRPEFNQMLFTQALNYTRADHYLVNYILNKNDRLFRVEAFHKQYFDLVKTAPATTNNGSGYAKGIEFFLRDKKTIRGLDYWISYSYLDTERDFLNYPSTLRPTFAARHTASLVVKKFFTSINTGFNFTYSFASGRPYYNFQPDATGKLVVADRGVTPNFNNLGFSANWLTKIDKAFAVVVASVTNVLNQKQVFGYNYTFDGKNKVAIEPPAQQFFFLGVFLSWGVDRRQDAINNNL
ncbi:MAG TPA: TonB-dependent receptor [Chitinophagaceae bacterium]|nr:TonB-dependent receptor [Chitinophagaceae bacterium]